MLPYLISSLPFAVIIWILVWKRKKRVKEFSADTEAQTYTCPVCRMALDTMNPCERCGFNPFTKEGGEGYVGEDVQFLEDLIK